MLLSDDFDRYPINTWPRAWLKDANASNRAQRNCRRSDRPNQQGIEALWHDRRKSGWPCVSPQPSRPPLRFKHACITARNACPGHPDRATIGLRQGTSWRRPGLGLIAFRGKGGIAAADDTVLQPYQPGRWYQVRIRYGRDGTTRLSHYWIDGIDRGQVRQPIPNLTTRPLAGPSGLGGPRGLSVLRRCSSRRQRRRRIARLGFAATTATGEICGSTFRKLERCPKGQRRQSNGGQCWALPRPALHAG